MRKRLWTLGRRVVHTILQWGGGGERGYARPILGGACCEWGTCRMCSGTHAH
jgi:hypothetical protein